MDGRKVQRFTKAYEKAISQAQSEANRTGQTRIVAETIYGVFVGTSEQFGGTVTGMYRTFVKPTTK